MDGLATQITAASAASDPWQLMHSVMDVRLKEAVPLNGGSCFYDISLRCGHDDNSGGYSALVPIVVPICRTDQQFFLRSRHAGGGGSDRPLSLPIAG